jgi:uncharacterized membrane protein YoaK (UPF0700 family)
MQRTRINTLIELFGTQIGSFFTNPWRRIALILLSFFVGMFMGPAIATTTGQEADWDVVIAAFLLIVTEGISRWFYRRPRKSLSLEIINSLKIGLTYSLYLEAIKLTS